MCSLGLIVGDKDGDKVGDKAVMGYRWKTFSSVSGYTG